MKKNYSQLSLDNLLNSKENDILYNLKLLPFDGYLVEEGQFIRDLNEILNGRIYDTWDFIYKNLPVSLYNSPDKEEIEDLKLKLEKIGGKVEIKVWKS